MINLGSILPVGTIIHSMLTTTQFAAEYGDNWVLMDGRSVTGTKYASVTGNSTIPDARGAFLRAKGSTYNPDGDLTLGTFTDDKVKGYKGGDPLNGSTPLTPELATQPGYSTSQTHPKNITVNVFIRIN